MSPNLYLHLPSSLRIQSQLSPVLLATSFFSPPPSQRRLHFPQGWYDEAISRLEEQSPLRKCFISSISLGGLCPRGYPHPFSFLSRGFFFLTDIGKFVPFFTLCFLQECDSPPSHPFFLLAGVPRPSWRLKRLNLALAGDMTHRAALFFFSFLFFFRIRASSDWVPAFSDQRNHESSHEPTGWGSGSPFLV